MRVLIVNVGHALGGAEHSLLLLVEGLRARGVEATVGLFSGGGPLQQHLTALGISTVRIEPPRWLRRVGRYERLGPLFAAVAMAASVPTVLRLARLARRLRVDLIHTNGMKAHVIAGVAGRVARIPVVWHLHDFPPAGWAGRLFRIASRRLPALVLATSDAVAAAVKAGGSAKPPVITLYNPVDLGGFHPGIPRERLRQTLGIDDDVPVVGLVAHLTPWKGHDLFLRIASALADSPRRPRFVIAGGPIYETNGHAGYADALRERAAGLGLSDRVTFLGARDDIPDVLAGLDVLVHTPTAPEPFGRVLAEAMAVGRPVVAPRCGGIPEVVQDRVTGLLVPPLDVEGFTSAVARLLDDPDLRADLGRAGRQRAEALFGVEGHVDAIIEAYRDIIAARQAMT